VGGGGQESGCGIFQKKKTADRNSVRRKERESIQACNFQEGGENTCENAQMRKGERPFTIFWGKEKKPDEGGGRLM